MGLLGTRPVVPSNPNLPPSQGGPTTPAPTGPAPVTVAPLPLTGSPLTPGTIVPGSPNTQIPQQPGLGNGSFGPPGTTLGPNSPVSTPPIPSQTPSTGAYSPTNFGPAPSGYDPTKWNDTTYHDPKYDVGRTYQSGVLAGQSLQTIVSHIQQLYPGTTWNGKDILNMPGIGDVDFITDFGPGGANGVAWQPQDQTTTTTPGSGSSAAPGSTTTTLDQAGAGGAAYTVPGATVPAASPYDSAVNSALMAMLTAPQGVDAATLAASPEAEGFNIGASRAADQQQAAIAETNAQEGSSNSGAANAEAQGVRQAMGQQEAQFLGTLANQKLQQQHDNLVQAIQLAEQAGQFQQSQELQLQLAQIDAAIREQTLAQQQQQFNLNLGFDYTQLQTNANQAAGSALL